MRKRLRDVEISLAGLRQRGWTKVLIRKYLGKPDREWNSQDEETIYIDNIPIFSSAIHHQRWNLERVFQAESDPEVKMALVFRKLAR